MAAGVAFVAIGVYEATLERDSSFDLAQFTMRLGYFSIAALLLAYRARHQHGARHAETSFARVEVAATDEDVFLSVQDSGCGFPFKGRYDLARLRAERLGPTSLIDRVADLGGELVLEAGSRPDIMIPCNVARAGPAENAS